MKSYIFGKQSVGDKIILRLVKDTLKVDSEYLGERVDLSRIKNPMGDDNLIVVINAHLFKIDLDKVLGYINKDTKKPLIVVRRLRTFGALFFKPNLEVDKITANKVYVFAGLLYIPKEFFPKEKPTISKIFNTIPTDKWRTFIVSGK